MNRINALFNARGDRKLLSVYFCAGFPTLNNTAETLLALQQHGVDMVEVGIPFSDPLADGPVIQHAGSVALKNGMTLDLLFEQLEGVKEQIDIPVILMGYYNVVLHRGIEAFCKRCVETGVSGMIIPDLPFDEYLTVVKPVADKYALRVVMMISPETEEERIRFIDAHTDGFIYMVSSASITGAKQSFSNLNVDYFKRIDAMNLNNPRMIGFGISNEQTLQNAWNYAAGAIIGSKFVSLLADTGNGEKAITKLYEALNLDENNHKHGKNE